MEITAETLGRSPDLFPHGFDPAGDAVHFVVLSQQAYADAGFLDNRILAGLAPGRWIVRGDVEAMVEATGLKERCDFIFHIGHVGSTLLSRLLGRSERLFCLREPAVLRAFAQLQSAPGQGLDERLNLYLKLWSRTYASRQKATIKATSFVSELAAGLMARESRPRALMLTVSPASYLATIFGGDNSRIEAGALAETRLQRLSRRLGDRPWRLSDLSEGEVIAMSWACETTALRAAAPAAGDRALWMDFDNFLANPETEFARAVLHLTGSPPPPTIAAVAADPIMGRYSKAPEYAYDTDLRRQVLAQARDLHGVEIAKGLRWLDRAAAQFPPIREAVEFAARR